MSVAARQGSRLCSSITPLMSASRGAAAEAAKSDDKAAWGLRSEKKESLCHIQMESRESW